MKTNLVYTLDFGQITLKDLSRVGGKNASLGELFNSLKPRGIGVLDGFATTADAYRLLLRQGSLEYKLRSLLDFDAEDVKELEIRGYALPTRRRWQRHCLCPIRRRQFIRCNLFSNRA